MRSLRALRPALALLQRGIVTGGEVDELLDLLRPALGVQGIVADTGWSFQAPPRAVGVPDSWQEAYDSQELRAYDPAYAKLLSLPVGEWFWQERDSPPEYFGSPLHEAFLHNVVA